MADVAASTGKSPAPSQPQNGAAVAAATGAAAAAAGAAVPAAPPSSAKDTALSSLVERLGYAMLQENGQRKLGPPPDWDTTVPPPRGCEVFIGKIPRDCFEDELVPVFERIGRIYEVRMMMDFNGANRGYCFVTYTNRADAKRAVRELNDYEIRERRYLGVCLSVDNCRLFVGGIPLDKQRGEIVDEMRKVTDGVIDAIVYPSVADKTKNRGFTFVEYESHRAAAMARRKLLPGRIQLWGQPIAVDWAEPEQEVDEEVMSKVKILYVRNLMLSTTEQAIEVTFNQAAGKDGAVERVKKLKDYAFVHFRERGDALRAMNALNGADLEGSAIEVVLAKPVSRDSATAAAAAAASNLHPMPGKGTTVITYPGVSAHQFVTGPDLYAASAAANGIRGLSSGRGLPMNPRGGSFNGRGRSAAGSRGAGGMSRAYSQRNSFRQQPNSEAERMYEIHPGMELIPIHPLTLKPVQHKSPTQLLEEYCQKSGWENPVYQLHSTYGRDGSGDVQLFLYKVFIPSLSQNYFMPNRLSRNIEEAKKIAAEYVLLHIGIPVEGVYQFPYPPPIPAGFHGY